MRRFDSLKKTLTMAIAISVVAVLTAGSGPAAARGVTTDPAAGAFAFTCFADLPEWPSPGNSGTCGGGPANAGATVHGTTPSTSTSMSATFTYSEPCLANEPPLAGFASGNADFGGGNTVDFTWIRVGLTAVVVVNDLNSGGHNHNLVADTPAPADAFIGDSVAGAGVAAFVPLPQFGTCEIPDDLRAAVVGAGAAAGVED